MDEIVAPDRPLMMTWGFDSGYREAFGFEGGDHGLVWLEQRIVHAASHPQQTKICFLRGGRWKL